MKRKNHLRTMNFKFLIFVFLCVMVAMLCLISCDNEQNENENVENRNESSDANQEGVKTEDNYHTVTFVTNYEGVIDPVKVENGKQIPVQKNPERKGYSFDGWYLGEEKWSFINHVVTIDLTLEARWIANENSLVFDGNGHQNGAMNPMLIKSNESTTLSINCFEKPGYTFLGWSTTRDGEVEYTDGSNYKMGVERENVLYAVWQINENAIVFNANGGYGNMGKITAYTGETVVLTENAFERLGYTFLGWSTSKQGEVEFLDRANYEMGDKGENVLYAVWKANENTLMFNSVDGSGVMNEVVVATAGQINLPANQFTRPGYTFLGWSTVEGGKVEYKDRAKYTMGAENSYTLYAVWKINTNSIFFNANGGKGVMSSLQLETGNSCILPSNSFLREGYTFKGWTTSNDGVVMYENGANYTMGTESIYTLYAVWEINIYTISYEFNGGAEISKNPTTFTINDLPIVLNGLSDKNDYLFDNWYAESDFSDSPVTEIQEVGNLVLYARYISGTSGLQFTESDGEWTVTGYTGNSPEITIPSEYKSKKVSTISKVAFQGNKDITSIVIPNSILTISSYAFRDCLALTIYTEHHSQPNEWFSSWNSSQCPVVWDCKNNDVDINGFSYVIYDNVRYSLKNTTATVVVQPQNIKKATIPASITYKGKEYKVTSIVENAFACCYCLTKVVIPVEVVGIGKDAFLSCIALTIYAEVSDLPWKWDVNGWNPSKCPVVWNCNSNEIASDGYIYQIIDGIRYQLDDKAVVVRQPRDIEKAIIPTTVSYNGKNYEVTSIGDYAFASCQLLSAIVIPERISSVGTNAFYNLSTLTIYVEAESTPQGWASNWNSSNCPVVWDCNSKDVEIDGYKCIVVDGIRYIIKDDEAIVAQQSKDITSANIPERIHYNGNEYLVTSLGDCSFYGCTLLGTVSIPKSVTSIGKYSFYDCTSIESIVIFDSVEIIGYYAFYNCSNLKIYCEAPSKPYSWNSFWNKSNCPVSWGNKYED